MAAIERIKTYEEVFEFLTSTPTPEQIIAFRPSEVAQERIRYLLDVNRNGTLTAEERTELDELSQIEHFMQMLKIWARRKAAKP
jgi:hypothetical protein